MKKAKEFIRHLLQRRQEHNEAKREQQLRAEANRRIQAREFEDDIYICMDGMPLLLPSDIGGDICGTIANMRDCYVYYKMAEHRRPC